MIHQTCIDQKRLAMVPPGTTEMRTQQKKKHASSNIQSIEGTKDNYSQTRHKVGREKKHTSFDIQKLKGIEGGYGPSRPFRQDIIKTEVPAPSLNDSINNQNNNIEISPLQEDEMAPFEVQAVL
eukprot:5211813-Ditylum_brightwellii.AAC.1